MRFFSLRAALLTVASAALLGVPLAAIAQPLPAPQLEARAWLLVDLNSSRQLAAQNAAERVEPASLTKLMTAYLAFAALRDGRIQLDQQVRPSNVVLTVGTDESRMFIEPNKPVAVRDLLQGMIVQSGNDASLALAELVGESVPGFVAMMNQQAQQMGMKGTHFVNPTGIPDPDHYTTAQDLALLTTRLIRDFPQYYPYYSQREFAYDGIRQPNRNRLLALDPSVDGVKTGHTSTAGYCLISSAQRPLPELPGQPAHGASRRLLAVVIGTDSDNARAQESLKLLNYGFDNFDDFKLYDANQVVDAPRIWKGHGSTVKLGVRDAAYVSVPKGATPQLRTVIERLDPIVAPVAAGQVLGAAKVFDGDRPLGEVALVALEAVPQASWFGRLWDTMLMWFHQLFTK